MILLPFGSAGDVLPFVWLGRLLRERGHRVTIITSAPFDDFVRATGMDFCGRCKRRVHNLDPLSDAEREALVAGCAGDVCIAYTVKRAARIPVALGVGVMALAGLLGWLRFGGCRHTSSFRGARRAAAVPGMTQRAAQ